VIRSPARRSTSKGGGDGRGSDHTTRAWSGRTSPTGGSDEETRPRRLKDLRYEWVYLFGAVCPDRDTGVALVLPTVDIGMMNRHLIEISAQIPIDHHAVLVLDGTGRHQRGEKLRIPNNISLLYLPPHSPELNPVENRRSGNHQENRDSLMGAGHYLMPLVSVHMGAVYQPSSSSRRMTRAARSSTDDSPDLRISSGSSGAS